MSFQLIFGDVPSNDSAGSIVPKAATLSARASTGRSAATRGSKRTPTSTAPRDSDMR